MARPVGLMAPRNGVPDDLQRIRGIGWRIERRLNELGIYHFGQIAAWTPAEMRWMAHHLAFPERIDRDDWIGQAVILASGGETGFVKSADRRRARRRQEALEDAIADESGKADEAEDESFIEAEETDQDEDTAHPQHEDGTASEEDDTVTEEGHEDGEDTKVKDETT